MVLRPVAGSLRRLGRVVTRLIPPYSPLIYRLCSRYVDRYNGDNNSDMVRNGELRLMQRVLGDCWTVFDVGANAGRWTAMALDVNPRLTIHCFEPSRETFSELMAQGFPRNIVCNNFGLSSRPGRKALYLFGEHTGMSSLHPREGLSGRAGVPQQSESEMVQLDTLDHYCEEHCVESIDLLKLDVEGHELEVCKGAVKMLGEGRVDALQFEYGGCNIDARVLLRDLFAFFAQYRYGLFKIYPEGVRPVPRYDQRLENFRYQNWLAVRQGCEEMVGGST